MFDTPIDNRTYKILEFVYGKNECTVGEICNFLGIKGISEFLHVFTPLLYLSKWLYIGTSNSVQLDSSMTSDNPITPNSIAFILPKGSAYVEKQRKEHETLTQQIEPIKEINNTLQLRVAQIEKDAATADRDARFSKNISIISIVVSIISVIVSVILGILSVL